MAIILEDIMKGIKETKEVTLLRLDETIEIRRLTAGEIKRHDLMASSGLKVKLPIGASEEDAKKALADKDIDVNIFDINEAQWGAILYIVSCGLSLKGHKKYSAKDVEKYIPNPEMIEDLANKILEFSTSDVSELESFHE